MEVCGIEDYLDLSNNELTGAIPESIGDLGNLYDLELWNNKLSGSLPKSIGNLSNLTSLNIEMNQFTGAIPPEIGNLENLVYIRIANTSLSGPLPKELGNLKKLRNLQIYSNGYLDGEIPSELYNLSELTEFALAGNSLTGTISPEISKLKNLEYINLSSNRLTGEIPESIVELEKLNTLNLNYNQLTGQIPSSIGNLVAMEAMTIQNNYLEGSIPASIGEMSNLKYLYLSNNKLSGSIPETMGNLNNLETLNVSYNKLIGTIPAKLADIPELKQFNCGNNYLSTDISDALKKHKYYSSWVLTPQKKKNTDLYESTDYSKDGEVTAWQKATRGNGIDVVILGDAFSDRLIADGTYDNAVRRVVANFFTEEPYASFKDMFNVYSVNVVSANEVYSDESDTAISGYFGSGTHVGGNDETAFKYAKKILTDDRMDQALIIVTMNSTAYAGTCWMYYPSDGDYGNGTSVAYFPFGNSEETFARLLHHEACGHGFAKLSDEYYYEGTIPQSRIDEIQYLEPFGWWKNIDLTSDPAVVKWSKFLTDSRYDSQGLGVYEGASTYMYGVWRPTENSIMRYNTGGFKAPSREAIYYRIHKLAYGDSWTYDYETFVKWDMEHRSAVNAYAAGAAMLHDFRPLDPPVVVGKTWREACKQ